MDERSNLKSGGQRSSAKSRDSELLSREEEFRRRNAEFEAKTAALVDEADSLLKDQESVLNRSLLSNVNADDLLKDLDDADSYDRVRRSRSGAKKSATAKDKPLIPPGRSHPGSGLQGVDADDPANELLNEIRRNLNAHISGDDGDEDVLSPELPQTGRDTQRTDEDEEESLPGIPPKVVGAETRARVLQAEVRVLREDNEKLSVELRKRAEEISKVTARLKDTEEERRRQERTSNAHRTQMDKYKKLSEEAKSKCDSLENQLQAVRKELDGARRASKQQAGAQNASEVRLNRALEEVQRLRSQLQEARSSTKDNDDKLRKQVDQLLAENKRLEKQKNDLVAGFKKQMKLIDVLKRQRMHVEAARMLQFAEEEFVKALDWGQ